MPHIWTRFENVFRQLKQMDGKEKITSRLIPKLKMIINYGRVALKLI